MLLICKSLGCGIKENNHTETMAKHFKSYEPHKVKVNMPSIAIEPGLITLSDGKLKLFHPELYSLSWWMFWRWRGYQLYKRTKVQIAEQLYYGDSRAAMVVGLDPLLIAAFSWELDTIAVLIFKDHVTPHPEYGEWYPRGLASLLIRRYKLKMETRLLTVNTYKSRAEEVAPDLRFGPRARGVYGNFAPYIADFLTDDVDRLSERKQQIPEEEWQRVYQYSLELTVNREFRPRDGRPRVCYIGDQQPEPFLPTAVR